MVALTRCPLCGRDGGRVVYDDLGRIESTCEGSFHRTNKVRKGRKVGWRTTDDAFNVTRGTPDLEDQDPEDRCFGGPGTVIVTVDNLTGAEPPETHACDDKDCETCHPKKHKRASRRGKHAADRGPDARE